MAAVTLRMADGPVANLPAGYDAYGCYLSDGGDGVTCPACVLAFPLSYILTFSTAVGVAAMCADVEKGALSSWAGYDYGYCSIANLLANLRQGGQPKKILTAHYGIGAHICSPSNPVCLAEAGGPFPAVDGTQWTDNAQLGDGAYDESLLLSNFFDLTPAPTSLGGSTHMDPEGFLGYFWNAWVDQAGNVWVSAIAQPGTPGWEGPPTVWNLGGAGVIDPTVQPGIVTMAPTLLTPGGLVLIYTRQLNGTSNVNTWNGSGWTSVAVG